MRRLQINTDALDAALQRGNDGGERPLTSEEAFRLLYRIWNPKEAEKHLLGQQDLGRDVLLGLWRVIWFMAMAKGDCLTDERLVDGLERSGRRNPWIEHSQGMWLYESRGSLTNDDWQLIRELHGLEKPAVHRRAQLDAINARDPKGLPLLPTYTDDWWAVQRWCACARVIGRTVGMHRTGHGKRALEFLGTPRLVAQSPIMEGMTSDLLAQVDETIVDECQTVFRQAGEMSAIRHFRDHYGFSRAEAADLVRMARADAVRIYSTSIDEERTLQIMALKEVAAEAAEQYDTETRLKALKQLATIAGLTRAMPEDDEAIFAAIVEKKAAARQIEIDPADYPELTIPQAPTPKIAEKQPPTLDDLDQDGVH